MADFFCVPVCVRCRQANECTKGILPPREGPRARKHWIPADEPDVLLKCGDKVWGWPVLKVLGENVDKVFCDRHGWQALASERKQKGAGKARKLRAEITGQGQFPESPPY